MKHLDASDKVIMFFAIVTLIAIAYNILRETPAQKATKEYNRDLQQKIESGLQKEF